MAPPRALGLPCLLVALLLACTTTTMMAATVDETCTMQEGNLRDKATGISFPLEKAFGRSKLSLVGVGPRSKNLYVALVKVYAVGLFIDASKFKKLAGLKFKGKTADELSKTPAYYQALLNPMLDKVVSLVFARSVGGKTIVDALTNIPGVAKDVVDDFSKVMLAAIGGTMKTDEVITLGWSPDEGSFWAEVKGKKAGSWKSADLATGLFTLYLGDKPVSQEAKTGFAALGPQLLK